MEYEVTLEYLSYLKPWSAEYVIAHAKYSASHGERPTVSFRGESDPEKSLVLAQWMLANMKHTDGKFSRVDRDGWLIVDTMSGCYALYPPATMFERREISSVLKPGASVRLYGLKTFSVDDGGGYEVRGFDIEGIPVWFIDQEFKEWIPKNLTWPPESNQAMICK